MAKLAICEECGCKVKPARLALHLQRVHGRIKPRSVQKANSYQFST